MPATIDRQGTISPPLESAVPTGSDDQLPMTRGRDFREGWQRVISDTLENWLRNPGQIAYDGIDPPTGRILRIALDVAEEYRDANLIAAPDRVVPDANGGIVFETQDGPILEVVHIWDDGSVEYMKFAGSQLVQRQPLSTSN